MKRARVMLGGRIHSAVERDGGLLLEDKRLVAQDAVSWLPPLAPTGHPRTILAVEGNYPDPARGSGSPVPPGEPLAFLKGERSLTGHRQRTRRPAEATAMRPGCALAVVIGRTARRVRRDDAYAFVAGYTVANDYTVGDDLGHWYRPSLHAKNRDAATPLGPWLVDAQDVADPMGLELRTTVNGRLTQSGHTRDLLVDVRSLLEYFTSFMTLQPGDLILTGSPGGAGDCRPGDVVVTEIAGLGALSNTLS